MPAHVEGLRQTVRALERYGTEVADLKAVFAGIAAEGASLAKGYAPKATGRLAGSVRGNKAKNKAVVIAGGARVPWAGPINYGWRKRNIRPRQFMQKADEQLGSRAVDLLEQGLDEAARKVGLE